MTLVKCAYECDPLCDFCIYYKDSHPAAPKICNGEGICKLTGKHTYLDSACDDFHCFRADETKEQVQ